MAPSELCPCASSVNTRDLKIGWTICRKNRWSKLRSLLLELDCIQKRFGGVTALKNGTCTVKAGEVHLLMGENGAGKSTLMKIVAGMITPDAGEMRFRGQPVRFRNPATIFISVDLPAPFSPI